MKKTLINKYTQKWPKIHTEYLKDLVKLMSKRLGAVIK